MRYLSKTKATNTTFLNAALKIILIPIVLISSFFSCTQKNPEPETVNLTYDLVTLDFISTYIGEDTWYSKVDTLYSDAVCLKLTIEEEIVYDGYTPLEKFFGSPGEKMVYEVRGYKTDHEVEAIKIYTLFDLNGTYQANSELSDCILFSFGDRYDLYHQKDEALAFINDIHFYSYTSIGIVLKIHVENSFAQFRTDVFLDDGTILSDTTDLINIIPSER
ncbi:hypothetical protein ACE1ET_05460 [Saccharicrinis sp. FJH62]|uniref:hypothetical protein n=1 Tax=Saccharicrinis sp. FJH62 TaxID=3344657 RepID=UPI0035D4311A